jgi:hypothetical protein
MPEPDQTVSKPPKLKRPTGWNQPAGKEFIRGFDTPQLYREDAIIRIRHMEREIAEIWKRMEEREHQPSTRPRPFWVRVENKGGQINVTVTEW